MGFLFVCKHYQERATAPTTGTYNDRPLGGYTWCVKKLFQLGNPVLPLSLFYTSYYSFKETLYVCTFITYRTVRVKGKR